MQRCLRQSSGPLAGQIPGGMLVADATVRGAAVGLTSAGLMATVKRLTRGDRAVTKRRVRT
jgi:hypothetical protein